MYPFRNHFLWNKNGGQRFTLVDGIFLDEFSWTNIEMQFAVKKYMYVFINHFWMKKVKPQIV